MIKWINKYKNRITALSGVLIAARLHPEYPRTMPRLPTTL